MATPEAKSRNKAAAPQRAAASVDRATALRQKLANAEPGYTPEDLAASASRQVTRQALAYARAVFDERISRDAEKLADAMVERALAGDSAALLTIARTVQPPAKYDGSRVELGVGPINSLEDVDTARRKLAEATFAGRVTIEDGAALTKMLDSIGAAVVREERSALLSQMRRSLAETAKGGVAAQIAVMTQRAELLLTAGNGAARAGETPAIEAVVDEDDPEDWRDLL